MIKEDRALIKKANQLDPNCWDEVTPLIGLTDDREVIESLVIIRKMLKARIKRNCNKNNT